ncbi:hypothetical protein F5Y05DRAFT_379881 [Hypoxylon sp. FL0543]|nr:hypothetical protein F5Y05DRAFT_379881 [Hypoxylon sp. FL0543]
MSVLSFLTNHLTAPSDVESLEESHILVTDLIKENTTKDGLRNLENYNIGRYGVTGDVKEYFILLEISYDLWLSEYPLLADQKNLAILLRFYPIDLSGPEFGGYLLAEWEDPDFPGFLSLVMIPRPEQAYMSNEQFWDAEMSPERLVPETKVVATRHGLRNLNVKATADWIMSVDPEDVDDLELPEESEDSQLRRYRREGCEHGDRWETLPGQPARRRPQYAQMS